MITITNEDNMALMARYPDNYFDLAIVDPPYGIGEANGKNASRNKGFGKGNTKSKKITFSKDYGKKDWDNSAPNKDYFNELKRVSKNQVIWGANHFIENMPKANSSCWIVWDKDNGESDFADCELAYCSLKTAVRKVKVRWNGLLQQDMKNKEVRIHPTQKPVALYKWILDKYAKIKCDHKHEEHYRYLCTDCKNSNVKILDTHLGSGSIAIACHDYKFNLTACELDKEYYDAAMLRIKNHTNQQKLF
jgi:site-specific DNA-methyltransferase (adenine-specific)